MPSVISPVLDDFVRITDELATMFLAAGITTILHSGTCVGPKNADDRQERRDASGISDHILLLILSFNGDEVTLALRK